MKRLGGCAHLRFNSTQQICKPKIHLSHSQNCASGRRKGWYTRIYRSPHGTLYGTKLRNKVSYEDAGCEYAVVRLYIKMCGECLQRPFVVIVCAPDLRARIISTSVIREVSCTLS